MKSRAVVCIVALVAASGFASRAMAAQVFSDTFLYTVADAFIAEGGWTTVTKTGTADMGVDAGGGIFWGNPGTGEAALEYNYSSTLAAGDVITMDANLNRPYGGYQYGMRVILWDGTNAGTRTQVAGGTYAGDSGTGGALNQVSYTVTAADILAGLDSVIFKYSHDGNWGETNDVSFGITPVPEPSSFVLAGLGLIGLAAMRRRRGR